MRAEFQMIVRGDKQRGVIYVRFDISDEMTADQATTKALKVAAKRSGDNSPQIVRHNLAHIFG